MWNSEAKYRDVNTTDFLKSSNARNIFEGTIIWGDDFGKLRLLQSPCTAQSECQEREYRGHSLRITNVKVNADGTKLFSVGGMGREIIQWDIKTAE